MLKRANFKRTSKLIITRSLKRATPTINKKMDIVLIVVRKTILLKILDLRKIMRKKITILKSQIMQI